jgi:hypothetical protein
MRDLDTHEFAAVALMKLRKQRLGLQRDRMRN